jgi:hypothetical protein
VTWSSKGRLPGGPFYGFFRGIFCEGMRREYDSNLQRLEELVTKAPGEVKTSDKAGESAITESADKK